MKSHGCELCAASLKYTIAVLRIPNPADENPELIPGEIPGAKKLARRIKKWLYWTVPQFVKQSSELSRPG